MIHKEKLLEIHKLSSSIEDITEVPTEYENYINIISEKVFSQKGVYTVLITLIIYKIINPEQDIRYHQSSMQGGFSGRTIDTQEITPTLKELKLPSMAESGWLTRSLEQPFPYILEYHGHINNKAVKEAFLNVIDLIQEKRPDLCQDVLRLLLNKIIGVQNRSIVKIIPLENPEKLTIKKIIESLDLHFNYDYKTGGGSKLPVLAIYAIYELLMKETTRFENCKLRALGSHTASDRTSKTAGDIEVFNDKGLFESVEIKANKVIDGTVIRIAYEKIIKFNPKRYYILSDGLIKDDDKEQVLSIIKKIKKEHGCQIIINGVLATIKYYLRLLSSLEDFINRYSALMADDNELKKIHKEKWNEIIKKLLTN